MKDEIGISELVTSIGQGLSALMSVTEATGKKHAKFVIDTLGGQIAGKMRDQILAGEQKPRVELTSFMSVHAKFKPAHQGFRPGKAGEPRIAVNVPAKWVASVRLSPLFQKALNA